MINVVVPMLMMLAASAPTASPQVAHGEAQSDICLTFALRWIPTPEETSRITTTPVPDSYRRNYGWTGCQHLMKGALIDWHLAFGDEESTSRALQFLSATALDGMPSIDKFDHDLPIALKNAQNGREDGASMQKLRRLVEAHNRFLFLASEYLRAAEFWKSGALLGESARYLAPTSHGLDTLYGGARISMAETPPAWDAEDLFTGNINRIRDLEMRYAITRAQLSGSAADLKSAADVVEQNLDGVVMTSAEPLVDRGRDYCDSVAASDALKHACDAENDLSGRLRSVWQNAALIELLSSGTVSAIRAKPFGTFEVAVNAIRAASVNYGDPYIVRYDETTDDEVELFLERAEDKYRRSQMHASGNLQSLALRSSALNDLSYAERLTPAALNRNRFRQIADLYLRIYDTAVSLKSPVKSEEARQAAYLRVVSSQLSTLSGLISPSQRLN